MNGKVKETKVIKNFGQQFWRIKMRKDSQTVQSSLSLAKMEYFSCHTMILSNTLARLTYVWSRTNQCTKCKVWVQMERMVIFTCLMWRNRAHMLFNFTSPKLKGAFYLKVIIQLVDQLLFWQKVKIMSLLMVFWSTISSIPN